MALVYIDILKLNVAHDYYADGTSADLKVLPTKSTSALMQNQNMLLRETEAGIRMFHKTRDGNSFFPLDDNTYTFGLFLREGQQNVFLNVTDLNDTVPFGTGRVPYFTNNPVGTSVLDYRVLHGLYPKQHNYQFPVSGGSTATLTVKDASAASVDVVFEIDGTPVAQPYSTNIVNGAYHHYLDFSNLPSGIYTLTSNDGTTTVIEEVYIDTELYRSNPLGIYDFNYETANSQTAYEMQFTRRSNIWKYYLVNKSGIDLGAFDLIINDSLGAVGIYDTFEFTTDGTTTIGNYDAVVILAQETGANPIPFYEVPKTGLQVRSKDKTSGDEKLLIGNAPNPSSGGNSVTTNTDLDTSEVFVYV